jgi:hypothetical protein
VLTRRAAIIGGRFSPRDLFAGQIAGAWFDPSDLSTIFQSGTRASPGTPVSAVNDPVGLILDKSGNHLDLSQATSTKRPTYQVDGNGFGYLQSDGVDDFLSSATATSGNVQTVCGRRSVRHRHDRRPMVCTVSSTDRIGFAAAAAAVVPNYRAVRLQQRHERRLASPAMTRASAPVRWSLSGHSKRQRRPSPAGSMPSTPRGQPAPPQTRPSGRRCWRRRTADRYSTENSTGWCMSRER